MIIFFTEDDLFSFGTYLLSDERKAEVIKSMITPEHSEVIERLKIITDSDIQIWGSLEMQRQNGSTSN